MTKRKPKKTVRAIKRRIGKKASPKAKAARGYEVHTGKPTGREVQAMHRLQVLTDRYMAEGLTPADASTHQGLTRVHAQTRAANQMQILTPKPASHRTMLPVKTGPRRTRYPKAYVITGTASKAMIAHLL